MTTKTKRILLGIAGTILAAGITGMCTVWASHKDQSPPSASAVQKNVSGANNNAGRDINQPGRDLVQANGPVTINNLYRDTSKPGKPPASGGAINVTSYDQKGGITAAYVWVIKNATILDPSLANSSVDPKSNYKCLVDTINKVIKIQPKTGSWDNPFIGFPLSEKSAVAPSLGTENHDIINVSAGAFNLTSDSLFGLTTTSPPSTPKRYYYLHYTVLPSQIVYGNYPTPLYSAKLQP